MSTEPSPSTAELADDCAHAREHLRSTTPLVQCITNSVVTGFTANVLLALGAAPAMVDIVGEAGDFAGVANGLLVNLGTPSPEQRQAAQEAVTAAKPAGTAWVLDPVAIGALKVRTALAADLLGAGPTAVRGNASEILALAGTGAGGRGVESADSPEAAGPAAIGLARGPAKVVAVSGPQDYVTDGQVVVRVAAGDALLTKVTGAGCALGAVVAAFLGARGARSLLATVVAAHVAFAVAAERAAGSAQGPGSFAVGFLDSLAALTPEQMSDPARLQIQPVATVQG